MSSEESKYSFKPFPSESFKRFSEESQRIQTSIACDLIIEHVGSTAIEGLGGKGIVDVLVGCSNDMLLSVQKALQDLGYAFMKEYSSSLRLFFKRKEASFPGGIIHLHLVVYPSNEFDEFVYFRDYLIEHKQEQKQYEELKKRSSQSKEYRANKSPFIKNILSRRKKTK